MGALEGILAAIVAVAGILKLLDKWFSKTATEKAEKAKEEVDARLEKFNKNAPPDNAP